MDNKTELSELVVKLQQGEGGAFEEIYNLTCGKAYATALSIVKNHDDAEDILQDSYVTVLDKINTLDKPESFIGWFNIIVANKAKNFVQKSHPVLFRNDEDEELVLGSIEDEETEYKPGIDVENEEMRKDVMSLINNLSDEKRTVILLYYYNEMTIKQISQALEVNENTVKSRMMQAKKDLSVGVKELERKKGKLLGVAPIPLIIFVLRSASNSTASTFAGSTASAGVLGAVTAASGAGAAAVAGGTAATGGIAAKIAALSVAQKIIIGTVAAGVVTGATVGTVAIINNQNDETSTTAVVEMLTEEQTASMTENSSEEITEESVTGDSEPETSMSSADNSESLSENVSDNSVSSSQNTEVSGQTTNVTQATKTTTTTTTTKRTTTTQSPAVIKVNYVVTDSSGNDESETRNITAGSTINESDIISNAVKGRYDNYFIRSGSYPVTAEAGKTYEYTVYVWNN